MRANREAGGSAKRVSAYIDGFNLYYGLVERGWRRYLWLDVELLCKNLLKEGQCLEQVNYFTSIVRAPDDKRKRHQLFVDAIRTRPLVRVQFGHFFPSQNKEKLTDVRIATQLITGALDNDYEVALVISADSDLAPAIEAVKQRWPAKRVISVFPPKRQSAHLKQISHGYTFINEDVLKKSQFPEEIVVRPNVVVRRPRRWA